MNNSTVLRTESDGVEFFTVIETGESAVSIRGLARMSGVPLNTLFRWFSDLYHVGVPKWLKPLQGMPLDLSHEILKNGKEIKPIPAETASDFLFLVAENLHKKEAFKTIKLTSQIGLTSYIQSRTGWLPEKFKAAPEAHKKLSEFLSLATEWDRGVMMVVDWEGYEIDMSDSWTFIEAVVFSGFNVDEFIKFEDQNRQLGLREHGKSEQIKLFFERNPETAERMQPYTDTVQEMLRGTKNPQRFNTVFSEVFGDDPDGLYLKIFHAAIDYRIAHR